MLHFYIAIWTFLKCVTCAVTSKYSTMANGIWGQLKFEQAQRGPRITLCNPWQSKAISYSCYVFMHSKRRNKIECYCNMWACYELFVNSEVWSSLWFVHLPYDCQTGLRKQPPSPWVKARQGPLFTDGDYVIMSFRAKQVTCMNRGNKGGEKTSLGCCDKMESLWKGPLFLFLFNIQYIADAFVQSNLQ